MRAFRRLSKIAGTSRLLCLILAGAVPSLAQEFKTSETVRIRDYGRFPTFAQKKASWLYVVEDMEHPALTGNCRITILDRATPITMWNEKGTPYRRNAMRVIEERGPISKGVFLTDGFHGDYYRTWENWDNVGKCAFLGVDVMTGKKKANQRLVPDYRVSPGLVYPEKMRVGERVKSVTAYYKDGVYFGDVPYSIKLVKRGPVTVPAGRFPDCIKLRVSVGRYGNADVAEEWWAKGIGVVKIRSLAECSTYKLSAYDLKGSSLLTPGALRLEGGTAYPSRPWSRELIFPQTPYGSSSAPVEFTLANDGDSPLEVSCQVEGSYDFAFEILGLPEKFTIRARQARKFTARFIPSDPDKSEYFQALRVMSNNRLDPICVYYLIGNSPER